MSLERFKAIVNEELVRCFRDEIVPEVIKLTEEIQPGYVAYIPPNYDQLIFIKREVGRILKTADNFKELLTEQVISEQEKYKYYLDELIHCWNGIKQSTTVKDAINQLLKGHEEIAKPSGSDWNRTRIAKSYTVIIDKAVEAGLIDSELKKSITETLQKSYSSVVAEGQTHGYWATWMPEIYFQPKSLKQYQETPEPEAKKPTLTR